MRARARATAALLAIVVAGAGLAACAPRSVGYPPGEGSWPPIPDATAGAIPGAGRAPSPSDERAFTRLSVEPDGRIHVGFEGVVVARAEKIPAPPATPGGIRWLTVQCAPTEKAIAAMVDVAEVADARGWFVVTRVVPSSPVSRSPTETERREKPPAVLVAEVLPDGNVTLNGWTASADKVKTLLEGGTCKADQAIALRPGGSQHHQVFRAAGYLAAAGCEVVVVQRPPAR